MRIANNWKDYELIDCSGGERLERWGSVRLVRPDPQVIWNTPRDPRLWNDIDAQYHRSAKGGGAWEEKRKIPERWTVSYQGLELHVKCMGFKHMGVFPEQATNWDVLARCIRAEKRPVSVLNLFSYTGAASVACLQAGASVTHVDASKGIVAWAKENATLNGLGQKPVRWMVDDCIKFVQRELRRGSRYDIILMDPPSYGRGPGGEVWKLEDEIHSLIRDCANLLSDRAILMLVNSYTTGLSPSVMEYMLGMEVEKRRGGVLASDEIGLLSSAEGFALPCGSSAFWSQQPLFEMGETNEGDHDTI